MITDPIGKRRPRRIASALSLGVLLPLLVLGTLWPGVGLITGFLVVGASELLMLWADAKLRTLTPQEEMIGRVGVVAFPFRRDRDDVYRGNVQIGTESWTATAAEGDVQRLTAGRKVTVTGIDGLVLHVEPFDKSA